MNGLWINAVGMAGPVGLYSAAALAAMRAGLTQFELDDEIDFSISKSSYLEPGASRAQRTLALMEIAFAEMLRALVELGLTSIPLVLALPSPEEHGRTIQAQASKALSRMSAENGAPPIDVSNRGGVVAGRAGTMHALSLARELLDGDKVPFVLVGAMDSLVDSVTVEQFDRAGLLLSPESPDGRIPGEAAVFLLVSNEHRSARAQILALDHLQHPESFAAYLHGQASAHARGLTELFARLSRGLDGRVEGVFSGQPHGEFWGREFSYAYLRNAPFMPEPLYHRDVGAELGDVGAAAGAVAILQAMDELNPSPRLYLAPRETALVYAVSDRGDFGGCVLRRVSR
ncbi:3-oxoacyl-(acyl carrier protein) synthase [Enhygromyxa salina]|uniref:3-oxoacyl-(Acyl carrier protein) synthase n=1 Tax=Enhygromyxa salina TaxID=215803 RepID=A0A2S9XSI9_9BACT|nr:hypothetical protein [Enhygromyxa salina]PRP95829.1 3-oxoacyl-(acyl carrier protein) synthase [Enhygromyxa salina]